MRTHPCVGRCSHNVGDDLCRGCGRTIDEVRDWNTYTPEVKAALMIELAERRSNLAVAVVSDSTPTLCR